MIKQTKSGPLGNPPAETIENQDLPNIDLYGDLTFFASLPPESQQADASARSALGSFKVKQKEIKLTSPPVSRLSSAKPFKPPAPQAAPLEPRPTIPPAQPRASQTPPAQQAPRINASRPLEPAPKPATVATVITQPTPAASNNGGSLVCADCGAVSEDHDLICIECGSFLG